MQVKPLISRYLRRPLSGECTILVSKARSGTNYFLDVYSNRVRNSTSFREIFRPAGDSFALIEKTIGLEKEAYLELLHDDPLQIWQKLEEVSQKTRTRFMAKIFYDHASERQELWNYFRDRNRVIHLIRRNPFDSLVSLNVARQTGIWLHTKAAKSLSAPEPFVLSRAKMEAYIARSQDQVKTTRAFFRGADYSEAFYEDIGTSVQHCADTIAGIFDMKAATEQVKTGMRKQKNYTNQSIVSNYDEIKDLDRNFF